VKQTKTYKYLNINFKLNEKLVIIQILFGMQFSMKKILLVVLMLIFVLNCSIAQTNNLKNDSIEITLSTKKELLNKKRIPIFTNEKYKYEYAFFKDTLRLNVILPKDTMWYGEKTVIFVDYTNTSKNQILKVPISKFFKIKILIIVFNHDKIYIFKRKRKSENDFILKCFCSK